MSLRRVKHTSVAWEKEWKNSQERQTEKNSSERRGRKIEINLPLSRLCWWENSHSMQRDKLKRAKDSREIVPLSHQLKIRERKKVLVLVMLSLHSWIISRKLVNYVLSPQLWIHRVFPFSVQLKLVFSIRLVLFIYICVFSFPKIFGSRTPWNNSFFFQILSCSVGVNLRETRLPFSFLVVLTYGIRLSSLLTWSSFALNSFR